jgi:hypothetical protein
LQNSSDASIATAIFNTASAIDNLGVSDGYGDRSLHAQSHGEGQSEARRGEATDLIAFAVAVVFLFPFSAQKSHVKPSKHLNYSNKAI